MSVLRLPALALAAWGILAVPAAAQNCPLSLPQGFNGAVAYGAGEGPDVHLRGTADEAGLVPVAETTRFNLGSANKMMTAVAVGQLVEQGRMAFDAPLGRYLPELPPELASLRLEQVLSHTAGLSHFLRPDLEPAIAQAADARSLVPLVVAEPREEPGPFRYSNAGYVLAGAAVEAVTGLTYRDYVAQHIFPAAGIAPQPTRWQPGDAEGVDPEYPEFARSVSRLPAWPAGSLVISAPDLWRFGRALAAGRLVRPETLARMIEGGVELRPAGNGKPPLRYGLGLEVIGAGAQRSIGHTGGAPGVDAAVEIALESGRTVAVLANRSGTEDLNAADIASAILAAPVADACR